MAVFASNSAPPRHGVFLASGNRGKLREMRAVLAGFGLKLSDPDTLDGVYSSPEESGDSYCRNSTIKAMAAAASAGMLAVADDSGLEVFALDGRPGLRSARYGRSDDDRIARLLKELDGRLPARARFVCVATIARPDGDALCFRGECSGVIVAERRGCGGFGFDPVFEVDGLGMTMAELPGGKKNGISHRGRALSALGRFLSSPSGLRWCEPFLPGG